MTSTKNIMEFFGIVPSNQETEIIKDIIKDRCEKLIGFRHDRDEMSSHIIHDLRQQLEQAKKNGWLRDDLEFVIATSDDKFPMEVIVVSSANDRTYKRFSCFVNGGVNNFSVSNEVVVR